MSVTRSGRSKWFLTLAAGLAFFAVSVTLLVGSFILPQQALEHFGAPDGSLTWTDNLVYSVQLFMVEQDLKTPVSMLGPEKFIIDLGESASVVAEKLAEQNLISSSRAFELYLMYSGLDRTIQAGEYTIEPGLNAVEIAHQMQDATPADVSFTVLAGWRVEEIALAFPTSGLEINPEDFLEAVENSQLIMLPLPTGWQPGSSLEGLFSPGTYTLPRNILLESFISEFIKQFDTDLRLELENGFARNGLTFMEGVILASIVEKEAVVAEEHPLIASVFINRLQVGMKLESDPTVQYAVGYDQQSGTWWKNPLITNDLGIDSHYNTYLYPGLPPGPICSPSNSALRAVAAPAQTDYFYFRTACDNSGKHNFSITYDQHLNSACP